MSGPLPCRNDTQCRPRFGDIWRCRRHVGDTSATCGAKKGGRPTMAQVGGTSHSWRKSMSKNTTSRTTGSHGATARIPANNSTRVWDPKGEGTLNVSQLIITTTPKVTMRTMSHADRQFSNQWEIPNLIVLAPTHPREPRSGLASKA